MIINVIGICIVFCTIWFLIEIWKAPLLRENPDGSWTTLRKERKIMDFFKKKSKTQ